MSPDMQGGYGDNSGYLVNTEVGTYTLEEIEGLYDVRNANGAIYYEVKEQYKDAGHPPTILISPGRDTDRSDTAAAYQCFVCEATSSRKADLERHYNTQHNPQPEMTDCPRRKCTRKGEHGFTRKDHLREHMRNYHMEKLPKRPNHRRDSN